MVDIIITSYFQDTVSFNIKLHMKWYSALIKNTMGLKLLSTKPGFATQLCDLGQVTYLTMPSGFYL